MNDPSRAKTREGEPQRRSAEIVTPGVLSVYRALREIRLRGFDCAVFPGPDRRSARAAQPQSIPPLAAPVEQLGEILTQLGTSITHLTDCQDALGSGDIQVMTAARDRLHAKRRTSRTD